MKCERSRGNMWRVEMESHWRRQNAESPRTESCFNRVQDPKGEARRRGRCRKMLMPLSHAYEA